MIPGFVKIQFRGLFFEVVISVVVFLRQVKDGGNFILSVSSGWLYFQAGS